MVDWHILLVTGLFIVADIVFGFAAAVKNKCVESEKMREGLWHKSGFVGIVLVSMLCEYGCTYLDLGFDVPLTIPVCCFVCWTELVSIYENLCKLSPELANSKIAERFNIESHGGN